MGGLASLFATRAGSRRAAPAASAAAAPLAAAAAGAQALARSHRIARVACADVVTASFAATAHALAGALQELAAAAAHGQLSPSAALLLADRRFVERALHKAGSAAASRRLRDLPRLASGEPRVVVLVRAAFAAGAGTGVGAFDALRRYVAEYQTIAPLTLGELRALPSMLRLILLEALQGVAAALTAPGAPDGQPVRGLLDGLRRLEHCDWRALLEALSVTEATLRKDPAAIYPMMDSATREQYRDVVARLARRSGVNEDNIARRALAFANFATVDYDEHDCRTHVGYYLVDAGRRQLESALGIDTLLGGRELRLRERELRFFAALGATAVLLAAAAVRGAEALGSYGATAVAVGLGAALAASDLAVRLLLGVTRALLRPARLPRLDFAAGIPPAFRTLVAVSAILRDAESIERAVAALAANAAATRDDEVRHVLLADFADASAAQTEADDALAEAALAAVARLNAQRAGGGDAFVLLLRRRSYDAGLRRWIGRDRRRGQLDDLNALLLDGRRSAFSRCPTRAAALDAVRYVIVLDSDARLPRGGARRLIATLAHPLNRAVRDPAGQRITVGYGVLQPRLVDACGVVPARPRGVEAARNVYQDAFGECRFTGIGIYDVAAYDAVNRAAFPSGVLLDGNLLPGCLARCGYAGDVIVRRCRAHDWTSGWMRHERGVRADWQLGPWLWSRVRDARGRDANPLPAVAQWWILDRMRRSLVPLATLLVLLAAWGALPEPASWTLLLAGVWVADGWLRGAPPPARRSRRFAPAWRRARVIGAAALRACAAFAALPYAAAFAAAAIGRACVRLAPTRRGLLQRPDRADASARRAVVRWTACIALLVAAMLGGVAAARPGALAVAGPVCVAWLLAPFLVGRGRGTDRSG